MLGAIVVQLRKPIVELWAGLGKAGQGVADGRLLLHAERKNQQDLVKTGYDAERKFELQNSSLLQLAN